MVTTLTSVFLSTFEADESVMICRRCSIALRLASNIRRLARFFCTESS